MVLPDPPPPAESLGSPRPGNPRSSTSSPAPGLGSGGLPFQTRLFSPYPQRMAPRPGKQGKLRHWRRAKRSASSLSRYARGSMTYRTRPE